MLVMSLGTVWPWIGFGASIVLLFLLFGTNFLRSDKTIFRWRDTSWLAWACATAYLLHNTEEYGIDLFGNFYSFPNTMKRIMDTLLPNSVFIAVNIPMFWCAAMIAALLSRRNKTMAVAMSAVTFVNALSHIAAVVSYGYTPGLLTAVVVFMPISIWVFCTCFGKGRISWQSFAMVLAASILVHGILLVSIKLYAGGFLSGAVMTLIQIVNPAIWLLVLALAEKHRRHCLQIS